MLGGECGVVEWGKSRIVQWWVGQEQDGRGCGGWAEPRWAWTKGPSRGCRGMANGSLGFCPSVLHLTPQCTVSWECLGSF